MSTPRPPAVITGGGGRGVLAGTAKVFALGGAEITAALPERNGIRVFSEEGEPFREGEETGGK